MVAFDAALLIALFAFVAGYVSGRVAGGPGTAGHPAADVAGDECKQGDEEGGVERDHGSTSFGNGQRERAASGRCVLSQLGVAVGVPASPAGPEFIDRAGTTGFGLMGIGGTPVPPDTHQPKLV